MDHSLQYTVTPEHLQLAISQNLWTQIGGQPSVGWAHVFWINGHERAVTLSENMARFHLTSILTIRYHENLTTVPLQTEDKTYEQQVN